MGSVTSSQPDPHAEDLAVFDPVTHQATQSYALEGTWGGSWYGTANLAPGGLAWGDSTVLAAVLAEAIGNNTAPNLYEVHVMTYPLLTQSQIRLPAINPRAAGPEHHHRGMA